MLLKKKTIMLLSVYLHQYWYMLLEKAKFSFKYARKKYELLSRHNCVKSFHTKAENCAAENEKNGMKEIRKERNEGKNVMLAHIIRH